MMEFLEGVSPAGDYTHLSHLSLHSPLYDGLNDGFTQLLNQSGHKHKAENYWHAFVAVYCSRGIHGGRLTEA